LQIKVFKERNAKAAMDKVRLELGPDAVILHTKKYTTGGIFGYGGKQVVEVTAAIEDRPAAPILPQVKISNKKISQTAENTTKMSPVLENVQTVLPKQVLQNYASRPKQEEFSAVQMPVYNMDTVQVTEGQAAAAVNSIDDNLNEHKQQEKIAQLQQELLQMKSMLDKALHRKSADNGDEDISLKDALIEQEVNEEIINDILADTAEAFISKDSAQAQSMLLKYLNSHMGNAGIEMAKGKSKIVALIGATGVGKTTTLAKIASRFVLEQGLQAVLITADTYRISAVDQLKTYSDIIGLPLEIVYSPAELKEKIIKHKDKQLILIDTAGRSQHNDYQLMELHDLLAVDDSIEKHLVLSATTKYKDVIDIIRKFSLCAPDKVIFTKTDETSSVGMILNLLVKYPIILSYFTNGQSVPDDIFPAQAENLAELLLR